jgi:hypothetical protein
MTLARDRHLLDASFGNTGLRDGFFFAKARATPDCRGGRSRVLELVNGVPQ